MKAFACIAITAALVAVATPASAQFAKPEDAIKYRQSALSVMGTHFGRLGAMANGRVPFDAKVAADNAEIVAEEIAHLAAVFEEIAVADVVVADVILDHGLVRVVDGDHAVERPVDAAAADVLAGDIAAVMPVERIAAGQAFLTHPI